MPWAKPVDLAYDPGEPLPNRGRVHQPVRFLCYEVARRPGFVACFADGKPRFIRGDVGEKVIRGLVTRDGGEKVDVLGLE